MFDTYTNYVLKTDLSSTRATHKVSCSMSDGLTPQKPFPAPSLRSQLPLPLHSSSGRGCPLGPVQSTAEFHSRSRLVGAGECLCGAGPPRQERYSTEMVRPTIDPVLDSTVQVC